MFRDIVLLFLNFGYMNMGVSGFLYGSWGLELRPSSLCNTHPVSLSPASKVLRLGYIKSREIQQRTTEITVCILSVCVEICSLRLTM